jgi:nucleoside phosphorylase
VGPGRTAEEFTNTVDFGVLTVREDEFEPMARRCRGKALRELNVRGRQDYLVFDVALGKAHDLIYRLALVRSIRQGTGESQRRTSNIIEDFDPTWLMLVGIAGATPSSEFTLGDVVIATELHEFSVRAAVFGKGTEYRPGGGAMAPEVEDFIGLLAGRQDDLGNWNEVSTIGQPSPTVNVRRRGAIYGDRAWRDKVRKAISRHFPTPESTRKPQITTRPFAGGNVLIKDDALWQQWQSHARQVEAVEMELEGMYTAARTRRRIYPILVSKGISDIVGFRRDDAWTRYACETAASGALALLALRPVEPRKKPDLEPLSSADAGSKSDLGDRATRICISFAHSDGEAIARRIQQLQKGQGLETCLDDGGLEGSKDWWSEAARMIDTVEHLVLVLTPAALASGHFEKKWSYARERGVQASLVRGAPDLDYSLMPRWMRAAHLYNLDRADHLARFLRSLEPSSQIRPVPFMAPLPEPASFVERPAPLASLKRLLLDASGDGLAITAMLNGPGGFGKTALAARLCNDFAIRDAFYDGILWVTLGERLGDPAGKLADLAEELTGTRPSTSSPDAAANELARALEDRRCLLVVDDAWSRSDLAPFLHRGPKDRTARLVITRLADVLPARTKSVPVDVMEADEATALLRRWLPEPEPSALATRFDGLAKRLGYWPLLMELGNGLLRRRVDLGERLVAALDRLEQALEGQGLTDVLRPDDPEDRRRSAIGTLEASIEHLNDESERERFRALAVFAEDAPITLSSVARLWGCHEWRAEELCITLHAMSLLKSLSLESRELSLHDVVRQVMRERLGRERLRQLNGRFSDAWLGGETPDWAPVDDRYALQYLPMHLAAAGQENKREELLLHPGWLAAKLQHIGVGGVLTDYRDVAKGDSAREFRRAFLSRFIAPHINLLNQSQRLDSNWLEQHEDELRMPFFSALWLLASGIAPMYMVERNGQAPTPFLVPHERAPGGAFIGAAAVQNWSRLSGQIGHILGSLLAVWAMRVLSAHSFAPFQAVAAGLLPYRAMEEPIADTIAKLAFSSINVPLGKPGATGAQYVFDSLFAILCDLTASRNPRRLDWTRILLRYEFERRVDGTDESLLLDTGFVRRSIDAAAFRRGVRILGTMKPWAHADPAHWRDMLTDTVNRIFPEANLAEILAAASS